ncbi:MAG: glycosyltransferase family 4 protein [Deltaproteobacteria bacterium]|nr:glycosyltransferase family 4 protein [Deltaproteobacteria bacterium]
MRILFISDNFPPEVNAPATRTYEHCKEWVKLGAEVKVITCFPNFPQGRVYDGFKNKLHQKEYMDGIEVIRVWTYIAENKGFAKRIFDYMSFMISSFFAGLLVDTDVIIATSPQFFTTWSAYALSVLKNKPWIFELRDLWPESIEAVGAIRNKKVLRIFEKIELFLYRKATLVIALTYAFKENLVSRGIDEEKIKVVPNGSNLEQFSPREKNKRLTDLLGVKDKFVVGYIGTHGLAHGLDFIIGAIEKLSDPDLHFLFIGDGARKRDLVSLAKKKSLKNVTFLDQIPKHLVPEYMSIIDVALIPLRKAETFKTVIPSKIFEAAAMEKPILLGVDGEAKKIVEKYRAGLFFEPENESDFVAKLLKLKQNPDLYNEFKRGCTLLSRDYDRRRLAKLMYEHITEVVRKR